MPVWKNEAQRYEEEEITTELIDYSSNQPGFPIPKADLHTLKREEAFRAALLNEINSLTIAVRELADA